VLDRGVDGPRRYRLYVNGTRQSSRSSIETIIAAVLLELDRCASERPNGRLLLRAGAVEMDGTVVVIAGEGDRGKSTLTARLVQRGFAYLTDEVVALDAQHLDVLPYPKPLSVDENTLLLLGLDDGEAFTVAKSRLDPSRLGRVSNGGRVGLIVHLADQPVSEPQDPGFPESDEVTTLIALLRSAFRSSFDDAEALDAFRDVIERVPLIRLDRFDLDETCARIESILEPVSAR